MIRVSALGHLSHPPSPLCFCARCGMPQGTCQQASDIMHMRNEVCRRRNGLSTDLQLEVQSILKKIRNVPSPRAYGWPFRLAVTSGKA